MSEERDNLIVSIAGDGMKTVTCGEAKGVLCLCRTEYGIQKYIMGRFDLDDATSLVKAIGTGSDPGSRLFKMAMALQYIRPDFEEEQIHDMSEKGDGMNDPFEEMLRETLDGYMKEEHGDAEGDAGGGDAPGGAGPEG
jgi:hypothetical protein